MSILFLSAKPLCLDDLAVKTRNSLLIPWSGSKITEFGQNSTISNWKSKTPCFLPCYLPRIENCRFTGSACIRKIRVYPRELVGFDLLSCFQSHALDGTAGLHHWRYLRLAAGEGKGVELAGRKKDGTEFPLQLSLSSWKSGEGTFFTGILGDITERKKAEEASEQHRNELARSNAEFAAANKELEAFSYSVSHDLRAPLRQIDGFSKILLTTAGGSLSPDVNECLRQIREGTRHMGQLVDRCPAAGVVLHLLGLFRAL